MHQPKWAPLSAIILAITLHALPAFELSVDQAGGNGSFTTLEQARDEIRRRKSAGLAEPVTVWVAPGIYERTHPFELDERDSGTPKSPIVYRSKSGGSSRFLGGKIIDSRHAVPVTDTDILKRIVSHDARNMIRVIDLKAVGISDYGTMKARGFRRPYVNPGLELFIDGEPTHLARWPNEKNVHIGDVLDTGSVPRNGDFSERGGRFTYGYDRPKYWTQATDIWLSGLFGVGYADDTINVASIDTGSRTITLAQAHMYGIKTGRDWLSYYALNLLEEIDSPGEMFVDREAGKLYLYPLEPLTDAEIAVSLLEQPMLCLEGVSYVTFQNLSFEVSRGMGCYIERGEGNTLAGCTFKNLGSVGICVGKGITPLKNYAHQGTGTPVSRQLGSWHEHIYENSAFDREAGRRHRIVGCDIYNTGAGGVSLGGGDRVSLTPAENIVENCHIHHFNRLDRSYKAAVNIDGCGNRIRHCLIHDAPNNAIYLHGNDHIIELNEIHHTCTHADDMGAFYMGRDPSERGNIIRWNFWHHNGSPVSGSHCDIYFDDGSSGVSVHGNVFYGARGWASVFVHAGVYHSITNNIFVDCNQATRFGMWSPKKWHSWLRGPLIENRLTKHVDVASSPYRDRYPDLSRIYAEDYPRSSNAVTCNVLFGCGEAPGAPADRNLLTDQDPGFADAAALDFRLNSLELIREKLPEFQPIPSGDIGLRQDGMRGSIPLFQPVIAPEDGLIASGKTVSIASRNQDVILRYTLDGTLPGSGAMTYAGPFTISENVTVTARAFARDGDTTSSPVRKSMHLIIPRHPTRCTATGWIGVEQVSAKQGVNLSTSVTHCDNGDWVAFGPFSFDAVRVTRIEALVGIDPTYANQMTHVRLGSPDGPILATVRWQSTGSFHVFKTQEFELTASPTGSHELYWCFEGTNGICNLKGFRFIQ